MNQPKVSVITPIYNHDPELVRECLDSLKAQTMQDIEFILIDNEAIPEAKELMKEFEDSDIRFKVIHMEKNRGYGIAMNTGLREAQGEYIGLVESDDIIEPDMYEYLYNISNEHGKLDIIKGSFSKYYGEKTFKNNLIIPKDKWDKVYHNYEMPELPLAHASQWAAIYNKDFLNKNDIRWNESPGARHQDMPFMLKTWLCADKLYVSSRVFYHYRLNNDNSSSVFSNDKMPWGSYNEYKALFKWIKSKKLKLRKELKEVLFRREYGNMTIFFNLYKMKTRLKFFILAMYLRFRDMYYHGKIEFLYFNDKEKEDFMQIVKHPIKYYRKKIMSEKEENVESKEKSKSIIGKTAEFIFSVKNSEDKRHKVIRLMGLKIKVKNPKYRANVTIPQALVNPAPRPSESEKSLKEITKKLTEITSEIKNVNTDNVVKKLDELTKRVNILSDEVVNINTMILAQNLHEKTFGEYRNAFEGKDVVLVCTGPTAQSYTPIKDAIHVGINGAVYLNHIVCDYIFCQDFTDRQTNNETLNIAVNEYRPDTCKKFYGIIPSAMLKKVHKNIGRIPLSYSNHGMISQYILEEIPLHNLAYDISREPVGNFYGTPFSAMQFLMFANPKRIFLVGCDCSSGYAYNKEKNFISVAGQREIWINHIKPHMDRYFKNIEIISINPVGLKGQFKDVYTQSYLDEHPEIKEENPEILSEDTILV